MSLLPAVVQARLASQSGLAGLSPKEQPGSLYTMQVMASCDLQILLMPFVMNLKRYPTCKTMVMMMQKRWLCDQEHRLPSQRTQVRFLHLRGDSPLSRNSSSKECDTLFWSPGYQEHKCYTCMLIHTKENAGDKELLIQKQSTAQPRTASQSSTTRRGGSCHFPPSW